MWLSRYLKGKKPDMSIWIGRERYQGIGGISRGKFLVRTGAEKGVEVLRPVMPPMTVKEKPTRE
jgi:hypothetical protein